MVMTAQERRWQRLLRRVEELRTWRNERELPIEIWHFTSATVETSLRLGDPWPVVELPVIFSAAVEIPQTWAGEAVELELWLGGEGFVRISTGVQSGLNAPHHRFPVLVSAAGGETITIDAEVVPKGMFGSHVDEPRIERAHLVVPALEVRGLERDAAMIIEAVRQLEEHEVAPQLLDALDAGLVELAHDWPSATDTAVTHYIHGLRHAIRTGAATVPPDYAQVALDMRWTNNPLWHVPPPPQPLEPLPAAVIEAVRRARATIAARLEVIKRDYPPVGRIALTGHAHIDLAWLWPMAETRRKARRTFATVLMLMDRFDDFIFNQSSAQVYAWIEEEDPELFAEVRRRVAEGRWEPIGGSWLEPDGQITGGEAYVRQLFYGQRYFERAFGRRSTVAWLPDVFGFSGGIPQLLRGAGITGFFTIKLNWNEANVFPYDLFEWEGIDGSRVTAHMFFNPGFGYNGNIAPLDTVGTWRNFRGKRQHPESLLAFGWGDGGGGPTEMMLENYPRIADFPALPRLRMTRIEEFYASLPESGLPLWVGELYLEFHRGTLTSQALVKKLNREGEHRLLEAEVFGTIARLSGYVYQGPEIERTWKMLLLNQFHDILPGSSIHEVYQDTHPQLRKVVETASQLRDQALTHIGGDGDALLIGNAGLSPRALSVFVPELPAETAVAGPDGRRLPTQPVDGGLLVHDPATNVPGLGWISLVPGGHVDERPGETDGVVRAHEAGDYVGLENEILRVEIGSDGTIATLTDKRLDRAVLTERGNQLWAYVDKPRVYDAWDVDESYECEGDEVRGVVSISVTETGPLRASVRVERAWRDSRIVQTYRLWAGSARFDVETEINWHERAMLLRTRFPLAVHTHEATFETMYGVVRRPTHRNTSWDAARFEVSGHRFVDLSEPGYGVALLNDGKYGHSAHGNVLGLSLVRGPLYPDPFADEGHHHFTYSLFPHPGDWAEAAVTAEAFALNSPLVVAVGSNKTPKSYGFVTVEGIELALGALKPAEDGNGVILRVYEPHGARGTVTLRFAERIRSAKMVNLLEDESEADELAMEGDRQVTIKVRPFELMSLKFEMGGDRMDAYSELQIK